MRCKKAQGYYLGVRDRLIDEAGKLRLQEHLKECPSCRKFAAEMDECLDLVKHLQDESPSDNFEWNLKRRLMHEKAKQSRSQVRATATQRGWGIRFFAGSAAAAVIVLAAFWVFMNDSMQQGGRRSIQQAGQRSVRAHNAPNPVTQGMVRYNHRGYPISIRMASDEITSSQHIRPVRRDPFQTVAVSREDSLEHENALLRRRIAELEGEKKLLLQMLQNASQKQ